MRSCALMLHYTLSYTTSFLYTVIRNIHCQYCTVGKSACNLCRRSVPVLCTATVHIMFLSGYKT